MEVRREWSTGLRGHLGPNKTHGKAKNIGKDHPPSERVLDWQPETRGEEKKGLLGLYPKEQAVDGKSEAGGSSIHSWTCLLGVGRRRWDG